MFATALLTCSIQTANAQTFPSQPVRMIVPFGPGSATDITARQLEPALDVPVQRGQNPADRRRVQKRARGVMDQNPGVERRSQGVQARLD